MSETPAAPTIAPPTAAKSPAELAARYGLTRSGARPPLAEYARQLWARRSFIFAYASARNRAAFTESIFGQAWQVLTPLLNAGVYYLIFGELLQTKRGVHNFVAFLVTGVFIFNYTQRSMIAGSTAVTSRLSLIRALYFPRATLPLATTVIELQQLLWSMAVLFVIVLSTGEPLRLTWLLAIPALLLQTIFNVGVALILARLTTRFRDLQQLLPFMLRTLLYFSGVFWSIHRFTAHAPHLVAVALDSNPTAIYIQLMRGALITHQRVQPDAWVLALWWALLAFGCGFVYFWRAEESYGRG
jgi:teichoic acid transport system permease protein